MYEVGKKYLVDVAICKDLIEEKRVIIPILPLKHKDPAFGVNYDHYHVDCRFEMEASVMVGMDIRNFTTTAPLWTTDHPYIFMRYRILKITKRRLKCVNLTTGFDFKFMEKPEYSEQADNIKKYWSWYASMVGKSCPGKRCPHYGTEMIDNGKHLQCPMHNLIASKRTCYSFSQK